MSLCCKYYNTKGQAYETGSEVPRIFSLGIILSGLFHVPSALPPLWFYSRTGLDVGDKNTVLPPLGIDPEVSPVASHCTDQNFLASDFTY